ncbi:serine-rich adhesin for platelets-like isoform X2 [Anopheles albimanus]|uniref:serine-rich adhesin for platelets-like isoform X2 n=1 Tax=Anopheles albimanus TaxID=7167 RepID=UPI00163ECCFA|nr:serine-rich adhesin for platelets-like isoform X2 [Anopheles albimanus]
MDSIDCLIADELIPESCLESEWIEEAEVFAILKQWESCGNGALKIAADTSTHSTTGNSFNNSVTNISGNNSSNTSSNTSNNRTVINLSHVSNESGISQKQGLKYDTRTFVRPRKKLESTWLQSSTASSETATTSSPGVSQHELTANASPLLNVQIGGPVTPSLVNSATGSRLMMQRSLLNDVSPPCSIMNSMEYSANEKFTNSLITSGDFSSVGCLLNASDADLGSENTGITGANYNGYSLYNVMEDRQRLENLCLDEESTLTKDCNISRTDLNAIESVSGVSTMQNSYESGGGTGSGASGSSRQIGSGKPSFDDTESTVMNGGASSANTTLVLGTTTTVALNDGRKANETFQLPATPDEVMEEHVAGLLNGGTYDKRRPRNFNTYRKPRTSINQTFEELPNVDNRAVEGDETSHDIPGPVKHTVMNSTFGIVDEEQLGGATGGTGVAANATFVAKPKAADIGSQGGNDGRLLDLTLDAPVAPEYKMPFGRTFKRRPREQFSTTEEELETELISPIRPATVPAGSDHFPQQTPSRGFLQNANDSRMLVQSTPFHGSSQRGAVGSENDLLDFDVSLITPPDPTDGGLIPQTPVRTADAKRSSTVVRRSRNLEQELQSEGEAGETDDFDVQIRRTPGTTTGRIADPSNFLDAEKRISLQHFEEFEKSILESEHSGVDFDEMLNSLTADVRRTDESDKLRQSLDNIKKRHSRINLEKQQQDEMKRKLHQLETGDGSANTSATTPLDNKLVDSMTKSSGMSSSSGSERLLNRRSRYNEDLNLSQHLQQPQQQQQPEQKQLNSTITLSNGENGSGDGETGSAAEPDRVSTGAEAETYDRKNRDRFKTIRIIKKKEDELPVAVLPDADQPSEPELPGSHEFLQSSPNNSTSNSSAFSRVDHNSQRMGAGTRIGASNQQMMKTDRTAGGMLREGDQDVFKKPQAIVQPVMQSTGRTGLSKPRYYTGLPSGIGGGTVGSLRKDLSLPLGTKASSTDSLEQQQQQLQQQQHSQASRLAAISKLGGGSGGLIGTGRYAQYSGLQKPQLSSQLQPKQQQQQAPALKSPMGTKSKSYHSLSFAQAGNSTGYGGSSSNLSKVHGSSALQLKLKHNSSNTELKSNTSRARASMQPQQFSSGTRAAGTAATAAAAAAGTGLAGLPEGTAVMGGIKGRTSLPLVRSNQFPHNSGTTGAAGAVANATATLNATTTSPLSGVQMRTTSSNGGLAKTSRLGLVRPSSGYFSYSTHRKHPDSDSESVNSLSSSSASSRGSLYRVDSQSVANNVQSFVTAPTVPSTAGPRHGSNIDEVNGTANGAGTKLNGATGSSFGSVTNSATATAAAVPTTNSKPSGLRPPSALRPPSVRSGLPRPTSYIRR